MASSADLDIARATTVKMLSEYRSKDKAPLVTIRKVLEKGGEYGWASTLVLSKYGIRLGAFLLEFTTDLFALAISLRTRWI